MQEKMLPTTQYLYDIITATGGVTKTQVHELAKGYYATMLAKGLLEQGNGHSRYSKYSEEVVDSIVSFLYTTRKVKILGEQYLIPYYQPEVDTKKIASLWVMMDLVTTEYGCDPDMLSQIIEGNGIVDFSYVQDASIVVNLINIQTSDRSKLIASNQRFYDYTGCAKGEEKDQNIVYIYVTESLKAADMVVDFGIKFPHKVAYVEGDLAGNPVVKYLE